MRLNKTFSTVRIFAIVALATALIFAGNAFAASNSVPETSAGDGQSPITGYTVANVHYTLSDSDPTLVTAVSFDLTSDNGGLPRRPSAFNWWMAAPGSPAHPRAAMPGLAMSPPPKS